jgi:putative serine protease PepD
MNEPFASPSGGDGSAVAVDDPTAVNAAETKPARKPRKSAATPPLDAEQAAGAPSAANPPSDAFERVPTATPLATDYVVPAARPRENQVPTVRKRTVAAIAAGSLALGALGGVGAYVAMDALNEPAPQLPPVSAPMPGNDERPAPEAPANAISAVITAAMPSVVQIEVTSGGQPASTGSGFVIREDGYILTNNHVVDQDDPGVTVVFSDGSEAKAEIVGTTGDYDLAVLKVDRDNLPALPFGNSEDVRVGDPVIAIGSPLGLDSTVTTGIISALHRPVTTGGQGAAAFIDALQTDAAINPGNSGGPLLNMRGEVIGVNSAVAALPGATAQSGAGSVGLGFSIPSNQARHTADQLIKDGVATYPVIGVILDGSYTGEGVRVAESGAEPGQPGVVPGGPADRAGIREGDVIIGFEGRPVTNADSLIVGIRAKAPGDTVTFTIKRGDEEMDVTVTLTGSDEVDFGAQDGSGVGPRRGGGSD